MPADGTSPASVSADRLPPVANLYGRPLVVHKCALSEFWDRAHYPRYSIIRDKLQKSFCILDFYQKISDNVFHVWYS